jgi:hypothetical protein
VSVRRGEGIVGHGPKSLDVRRGCLADLHAVECAVPVLKWSR